MLSIINESIMQKYFLSLVFMLISVWAWSAKIHGVVKDEQGQPIPYMNIIILNHNYGTTTNEEGYYFIDLPYGDYELQAFYMGYETQTKKISLNQSVLEVNYQMNTSYFKLKEVAIVASDEDPAYEIMRMAYERKKQRIQNIKSFESDIYLKGIIEVLKVPTKIMGQEIDMDIFEDLGLVDGKGILYVLEQKSKIVQEGHQSHHVIQHIKESGSDNSLGISNMIPILDIYENRMDVLSLNPRGFITPLHPNAKNYYRFEYMGEFIDDGATILKIKLIPKRKYEPVFQGYVYVYDGDYDIHSVELKLDRTSEIDLVEEITIDQSFRYINGQRIIQRQDFRFIMSLLGIDFVGKFTTLYSNQQVNHTIIWPEKSSDKIIASYETGYNLLQSQEEWNEIRPIKISEQELKAYEVMEERKQQEYDSEIEQLPSKFKYSNLLLGGPLFNVGTSAIHTSGIIEYINFNTVEGLNMSLNFNKTIKWKSFKTIYLEWNNRYGFGNGQYQPNLKVELKHRFAHNSDKNISFNLAGGKKISSINESIISPEIFNSFTSLFYGVNPLKLVRAHFMELGSHYQSGTGWQLSLNALYHDYQQLHNNTDFSWVNESKLKYTSNRPDIFDNAPWINHSLVFKMSASYQPNWKYISFEDKVTPVGSSAPTFNLQYTKAVPINGLSKSNYDLLEMSISHALSLKGLGTLNYYISGLLLASTDRAVPWSEWVHFSTNEYIWQARYTQQSFFMLPAYSKSFDRGWANEAHLEWSLQGFITNKIPGFKRLNWTAVVGYHHLLHPETIHGNNIALFNQPVQKYQEFTFGLENIGFSIYRFLRVDAVMALDNNIQPKWGLRVGLSTQLFK